GCKEPGSLVCLSRSHNPNRRLAYTWELVKVGRTWVGINTLYPNRLVVEAIESGVIKELRAYHRIQREVYVRPGTRLDLCLERS
ncbi:MAG: DNA/RNA nuclease SfsA, partial [Deltaproteobacteria bacterium]|nr:DNA/RNA nuclease SfsA [Deltaproteobacteria bacterium]